MQQPQPDYVRRLIAQAESIPPPGTRFMVESRAPLFLAGITLCCDGMDNMMAYYCGREPGHSGKCHSFNKQVDFDPTNR